MLDLKTYIVKNISMKYQSPSIDKLKDESKLKDVLQKNETIILLTHITVLSLQVYEFLLLSG